MAAKTVDAAPTAGQLQPGELAIDLTDRQLYSADNAGTVFRAAMSFPRAARKGRNLVAPEQMVGSRPEIEVITPTWGASGWGLRMSGSGTGALLVATFGGLGGLAADTSYALTFRARIVAGASSATMVVDLFPDTLPQTTFALSSSETAEPYEWVLSSASSDMASATLRFFFTALADGVVVEIVDIQFEQGDQPTLVGRSEADTAAVGGALPRSRGRRARDRYSAFDRIPGRLHDSIRAGTNATDLASYLQAIASDGEDVFFPAGDYLTTQKIAPPAGRKWYGAGRTRSRIRATAAFDLAATAVIDLGSTEPGATLQDLGIVLEQPTDAATRGELVQYPPAIRIGGPRARLDGVRISGAIDGVAAIGNCGGMFIDRLEVGAVGKGLEIDGALDFVHLPSVHIWPFGLASGTTYSAVYKDGSTIGVKIGRADGLAFGLLSTFNAMVVVEDDIGTIIPIFMDSLALDGFGARLVMNQASRRLYVGRCYSTKNTEKAGPSIEVQAGDVYFGHLHAIESGPAPTIQVQAGTCVVEGGLLSNLTVDRQAVLVSGGRGVVRGARLVPPTSNRSVPYVEQTGGALEVSDCSAPATGYGPIVGVSSDSVGNRVAGNVFGGWAYQYPPGRLGSYGRAVPAVPNVPKRRRLTGAAWLSSTSAADNDWRGVCWAAKLGLFVAVGASGSGNRVMTSPDGVTWTARTSAADNNWRAVCWSPERSLLVAVGDSGTGNRVMTSPDGITWTGRTSAADGGWYAVCWSVQLGRFVAVGYGTVSNQIMTSPDGIAWTVRTSPSANSWFSVDWSAELGLFVAVSTDGGTSQVMTSPDGVTWTLRSVPASRSWTRVRWSADLGIFVAVGASGTGTCAMTSPDGINWTLRTAATDSVWYGLDWAPEIGLWAAVSSDGAIMTSPDGIAWTAATSPAVQAFRSLAWSPELGLFASIASSGTGNRAMTSVSAHAITYRS